MDNTETSSMSVFQCNLKQEVAVFSFGVVVYSSNLVFMVIRYCFECFYISVFQHLASIYSFLSFLYQQSLLHWLLCYPLLLHSWSNRWTGLLQTLFSIHSRYSVLLAHNLLCLVKVSFYNSRWFCLILIQQSTVKVGHFLLWSCHWTCELF